MPGIDAELSINDLHAARDRGHAGSHQRHQLAHRHFRNVRFNQQSSLGLPEKNIACRAETFAAAGGHRAAHHPGHAVHHALENSPMIKERGERRDDDDRGRDRDGEDVAVARTEGVLERVAIRKWAENHLRAFDGENIQLIDGPLRGRKDGGAERRFQNEERKNRLQEDAPNHGAPREPPAIDGKRPRRRQENEQAERADESQLHASSTTIPPPVSRLAGPSARASIPLPRRFGISKTERDCPCPATFSFLILPRTKRSRKRFAPRSSRAGFGAGSRRATSARVNRFPARSRALFSRAK